MAKKRKRIKPKCKSSLATLHRRAEKGWMFRGIELSWCHFLWSHIVIAQTAMLAVLSYFSSLDAKIVSRCIVIVVFYSTAAQLVAIIWMSRRARDLANIRSIHFERSVTAGETGRKFDNKASDDDYYDQQKEYISHRVLVDRGLYAVSLGTFAALAFSAHKLLL